MKKFDVIEDNGGGLAILVYTNDRALVEYIHTGYEFNPGQLIEDLINILEGADPLTEWDGNEVVDDEQRCFLITGMIQIMKISDGGLLLTRKQHVMKLLNYKIDFMNKI